ncbi:hypothetical protein D3C80_1925510 [compost metagenome]
MQHRGEMIAQGLHGQIGRQPAVCLRLLQPRDDRCGALATMAGQPVTYALAIR